jgi:hypothetical protein
LVRTARARTEVRRTGRVLDRKGELMLRASPFYCLLILIGCGAAAGNAPLPAAGRRQAGSGAEGDAGGQAAGEQAAAGEQRPAGEPGQGAPEEQEKAETGGEAHPGEKKDRGKGDEAVIVQAGTVPRDSLVKVLDRGVARFLQQIDTRPLKARGRFVGWKLLAFFPGDERFADCAVKAGDTVLRVNGRSIERPESFKSVWDSLYTARELKVLLLRAGRVYELHYAIEQQIVPENDKTGRRASEPTR